MGNNPFNKGDEVIFNGDAGNLVDWFTPGKNYIVTTVSGDSVWCVDDEDDHYPWPYQWFDKVEPEPEADPLEYNIPRVSDIGTALLYSGGQDHIITTGQWVGEGNGIFQLSARLNEDLFSLLIADRRILLTFEQADEFSRLLDEVLEAWAFRRDVSEDASEVEESLAA